MNIEYVEAFIRNLHIEGDIRKNTGYLSWLVLFLGAFGCLLLLPQIMWLVSIMFFLCVSVVLFVVTKKVNDNRLYWITGIVMMLDSISFMLLGVLMYHHIGGNIFVIGLISINYLLMICVVYNTVKNRVASGYYLNKKYRKRKDKSVVFSSASVFGVVLSRVLSRELDSHINDIIMVVLSISIGYVLSLGIYYLYKDYLMKKYKISG